MTNYSLEEILNPRSIAVVGASRSLGKGPNFVKALLELGFKGKIYPVNPNYPELFGLTTYPSLKEIPGTVDYVICAIPAQGVSRMLEDGAQKGLKVAQLYTGRFSETGRPEDAETERQVLNQAKKLGIRIIGPNCMGVYYPGHGMGWSDDFSKESGSISLASQSSYAAHDFILLASPRGIRFNKVIAFGNAIDLNECDFLDYLARDPETKIILMYLEGVKNGKKFFNLLRQTASIKPIIVVKGGRGTAGARAVVSHTASLAGSMKIWNAAIAQTGAIPAESFDEMIDLAVSFLFLPPIKGRKVNITASGGGPGVLAADICEEEGLDVISLPNGIREELKARGIAIWDWIGNPIDLSITHGIIAPSDLLKIMSSSQYFDFLITIMGEPHYMRHRQDMTADAYLEPYDIKISDRRPLLAIVPEKSLNMDNIAEPGVKLLSEIRTKLIAANTPVYPSVGRAAKAVRKMIGYYARTEKPK